MRTKNSFSKNLKIDQNKILIKFIIIFNCLLEFYLKKPGTNVAEHINYAK